MSIITKLLDKKPHIDFIKYHKIGFVFAFAMLAVAVSSLWIKGLNYGIDFMGGILIEVSSSKKINTEEMRSKMAAAGIKDFTIQSMGLEGTDAMIRALEKGKDEKSQMKTVSKIKNTLGSEYEYRKVEMVGPQVGDELKEKSTYAAIAAVLAIAAYIWFRFESQFAVGALISLTYNTIVTLGFFSLIGGDFDLTIVAAVLTLIGYSINDTVVEYDRVRSNLKKYRRQRPPVAELLNTSLNETLGRTLLTSISTMMALVAILFLGGAVLRGFAMALLWGIVIGTFSSVFIAVPFLSYFDIYKNDEEE